MRLRLELRNRLSPIDGLAIRSNTIMGPHLMFVGGTGETRTHTPRVTGPSVFKTAAAMPIRLTVPCSGLPNPGLPFGSSGSVTLPSQLHYEYSVSRAGRHPCDILLVPPHRIELQTSDYKTDVIPFNYRGVEFSMNSIILA